MSAKDELQESVRASARGLVRDLAGRLDLEGVKAALTEIETLARRDHLEAEVTSAVPLTDAERARLEERLQNSLGRDLSIEYDVQPAILGGLVVRVGDRYLDGSVAARLGQLRQTLIGTR